VGDGNKRKEKGESVPRKQFVHDFREGDVNTFAHQVLITICHHDIHREEIERGGTGGTVELRIGRGRGESAMSIGRHGMEEKRNLVKARNGREEREKKQKGRNNMKVQGEMEGVKTADEDEVEGR